MNLLDLADKYETKEFLVGDPSWFMHQVEGASNKELLAFIASTLSYGSRKQFLPKIQYILDCVRANTKQCSVEEWLLTGRYLTDIPPTDKCFYRLYTNRMMCDMLTALKEMVQQYGSMKSYIYNKVLLLSGKTSLKSNKKEFLEPDNMPSGQAIDAVKAITEWFSEHGSVGIVPKDATSSCKRVCMFLRWMVRDNSPVDLGLWADIIDKRTLIIPLDTHVVQESVRLGLLSGKTTSMSVARKLSERLREIFPDDPTKGDFALFGVGVNA